VSLTILNVAYPLAPAGADTVGGAEQFVAALDEQITKAGHRSLVIAAGGSSLRGKLIASPRWEGPLDGPTRKWAAAQHARILSETLRQFDVDVVHLHGLDFFEYLPEISVPCIVTLHLPPDWYPPAIFELNRPATVFVCVSEQQRRRCPALRIPLRTIPHGVDLSVFFPVSDPGNYAVTLGRICPEKGFHFAIEAAEEAGIELIIAGQVYPYAAHERYFHHEVSPRLNSRIRFIGPAGLAEKRKLLSGARCVLIPSTVAETSSLVAMEALACGAPVIAFPSGALAEIVEHEKTGLLARNSPEMARAIRRIGEISREQCRIAARQRFNLVAEMKSYFGLYAELARAAGNDRGKID
jgi:glycosyltransferase involved in cell wall biosynthesis